MFKWIMYELKEVKKKIELNEIEEEYGYPDYFLVHERTSDRAQYRLDNIKQAPVKDMKIVLDSNVYRIFDYWYEPVENKYHIHMIKQEGHYDNLKIQN